MKIGINRNQIENWSLDLRIIATIAVIVIHVSAPVWLSRTSSGSLNWWILMLINSFSRFCVPVFLMLSGYHLFSGPDNQKLFLRKRFVKVFVPFICWCFIYILFFRVFCKSLNSNFDFNILISDIIIALKSGVSYHFWYLHMIIGIYLFFPIIKPWIQSANSSEICYFLTISFLLLIGKFQGIVSNITEIFDLFYFSGYIIYPVLGYLLGNFYYGIKRMYILGAFFVGFFIIAIGTFFSVTHFNQHPTLFFDYLSPGVFIYSIGVFLIAKHIKFRVEISNFYFARLIGELSFGIYLVHVLVLKVLNSLIGNLFNPLFNVLFNVMLCLIVSVLIVFMIKRLPFGRFLIGQ